MQCCIADVSMTSIEALYSTHICITFVLVIQMYETRYDPTDMHVTATLNSDHYYCLLKLAITMESLSI